MNLYQFLFGYQPHYVIALTYADAEQKIRKQYRNPDKIECLGPYVMISDEVLELMIRMKGEE